MAEITIRTLGDLQQVDNGTLARSFERAFQSHLDDCRDRPAVKAPRKLTLTVSMIPVPGADGTLEDMKVEFEVHGRMPVVRTRQISMGMIGTVALAYNELARQDRRQTTFDLEDAEKTDTGE